METKHVMINFSNELYLGVYCLILGLQIVCATINGTIIYFFWKLPILRQNKHLRLVAYLSCGDIFVAIFEMPYIIYMTMNWNPVQLDYNPTFIMISSLPLPIQLKISATITISLALNRCIALFSPGNYRKVDQGNFSSVTLILALTLALFDSILYLKTAPYERRLNCATCGCFVSDQFRYYWGISNMVLGFIAVFLSTAIFYKLRMVSNTSTAHQDSSKKNNKFTQANRTSTGILISSLLFLTVPSVCVGVVELTGYSIFKLVGPFYSAALLASGVCNGVIFVSCNTDARKMVRKPSSHAAISVVPSKWSSTKQIT